MYIVLFEAIWSKSVFCDRYKRPFNQCTHPGKDMVSCVNCKTRRRIAKCKAISSSNGETGVKTHHTELQQMSFEINTLLNNKERKQELHMLVVAYFEHHMITVGYFELHKIIVAYFKHHMIIVAYFGHHMMIFAFLSFM